jgi:hypothetical protein
MRAQYLLQPPPPTRLDFKHLGQRRSAREGAKWSMGCMAWLKKKTSRFAWQINPRTNQRESRRKAFEKQTANAASSLVTVPTRRWVKCLDNRLYNLASPVVDTLFRQHSSFPSHVTPDRSQTFYLPRECSELAFAKRDFFCQGPDPRVNIECDVSLH